MEKKGLIGIQLSTIRSVIERDGIYETMKRCHDLGYRCIEISQIPMTPENVAAFKRAQTDFGIKVAAVNTSITPMRPGMACLETDYAKILDDLSTLDCSMLRLGMGPIAQMATREGITRFCEEAEKYVSMLKKDGIDFYYHNHSCEFMKVDGKYILDHIKDRTSMGFELDIHWIHAGGEDPIRIINRYAGRIRLLHLKDFRIVVDGDDFDFGKRMQLGKKLKELGIDIKMVSPMYGAIQFAEVGEGTLPVKECIDAGLAGGSEYFLIEQDSTYDRDPLESLKISRDNLIAMGYGDWF